MNYPGLIGICKNCLGCNKLELKEFIGVYKCKNYMKGAEDENCKNEKQVSQQKGTSRYVCI